MTRRCISSFLILAVSGFLGSALCRFASAAEKERFVLRMNTNPLFSVIADRGYTIVAKEIWQYQEKGMGRRAPPVSEWDYFVQLELLLNKDGDILATRTLSGSEMPDVTGGMVGIRVRHFSGTDRIVARLWLKKLSARRATIPGARQSRVKGGN